jgi:mRNA capping enzyme, beta chain
MPIPDNLLKERFRNINKYIIDFLDANAIKNAEIEVRLGEIHNLITKTRIRMQTPLPIVFNKLPSEYKFINGVKKNDFLLFKDKFANYPKSTEIDKISISGKTRRISVDGVQRYERKIRRADLDIHIPDSKYDARISISTEEEVQEKDIGTLKFECIRSRERTSFSCNEYSFDFTKVTSTQKDNEHNMASKDEKDVVYEIEIEVKDSHYCKDEFIAILMNISH